MARIRSVKPEICESETMARLPAEVERTFVRLWTHCDDEGRAKDDARLIKAALFPLHDDVTVDDVEWHLHRLAEAGLLIRYSVAGKRYLALPSWSEHQHPQRPRDSKIPAPSDADTAPIADASRTPTGSSADMSGPVVVVVGGEVGVGVDGGVEVAVADPSLISGDHPVPDIEQTARKAVALYAEAIARKHGADNPTAYAAAVAKGAAGDGTQQALRDLVAGGATASEAVELLAARRLTATPASDPAVAEEARRRAHAAEEATAAKRAEITAPAVGDGLARIAAIKAERRGVA